MVNGEETGLEYIEECVNRQEDIFKVFRLLILHSLTANGLKSKAYQFFKREILQTYGNEYMFTFNNLEKLGLLTEQNNRNFAGLRKAFLLYNKDEVASNSFNPKDITSAYGGYSHLPFLASSIFLSFFQITSSLHHPLDFLPFPSSPSSLFTFLLYSFFQEYFFSLLFIFCGFEKQRKQRSTNEGNNRICPLSVRMIQRSAKPGGWSQMEEVLRQCPGPLFEETQVIPEGVKQRNFSSLLFPPSLSHRSVHYLSSCY